jgi:hypothetical protein
LLLRLSDLAHQNGVCRAAGAAFQGLAARSFALQPPACCGGRLEQHARPIRNAMDRTAMITSEELLNERPQPNPRGMALRFAGQVPEPGRSLRAGAQNAPKNGENVLSLGVFGP